MPSPKEENEAFKITKNMDVYVDFSYMMQIRKAIASALNSYGREQWNAGIEAAAREAEERGCYQTVRTCNAFLDEQTILHSYHCPEAVSTAIRSLKKLEDAT